MNKDGKKVNNFSLKKMMGSVGEILESVRTTFSTKTGKIPWMKTNLPETDEVLDKKRKDSGQLAVALPPAEVLVGKAVAYGTLDPGFVGIAGAVGVDLSIGKDKYQFTSDVPNKEVGFRWNGWNKLTGQGSNSNGLSGTNGQGLRSPTDRSSTDGHSSVNLPNTSPLTREEIINIIPFRNYTFYSDLDVDKYENYKGSSVLALSDSYNANLNGEQEDLNESVITSNSTNIT